MKNSSKPESIETNIHDNGFLEIDEPDVNPRFAPLLPTDLAIRCQAIPVARNGDRITVAMADPSDEKARNEILAVLGPSTCVVKARTKAIDKLLAVSRESVGYPTPNFLYWQSIKNTTTNEESYAEALSAMLGARLKQFKTKKMGKNAYRELTQELEQYQAEMLILGTIDPPIIKELIELYSGTFPIERIPASLLMVKQPRWPLKSILLILKNEITDESAIDWAVRIAQSSKAKIAILPLTVAIPDINLQDLHGNAHISTLLTRNCTMGNNLRSVARRLVDSDINGNIVLRQESPFQQICFELLERNYDLVVISVQHRDHLKHFLHGNLIKLLMKRLDLSVLVTKPLIK